jgi:hypothetical protein
LREREKDRNTSYVSEKVKELRILKIEKADSKI